jgi:hypothetical protein
MRNYLNKIFLLFFVFFFINLILILTVVINHAPTDKNNQIAGIKTSTNETTVSLSIGEFHFTLFGYTSPQAKVTVAGLGIFDETYADDIGYFVFGNRFSPFSPREACLTAQDVLGRLSAPLCLPPFPTIYNVKIGPVIMPPTVSADVGEYFIGDKAMLSGQTMPNTEVDLSMFTGQSISTNFYESLPISMRNKLKFIEINRNLLSLSLIKNVEAFSFPQLQAKSDEKGNFSISLPTNNPTSLRAFARSNFENSLSPKSLTLNIKVLPWWMIIFKIFGLVFDLLKTRWLEIGLLLELIILTSFLFEHFFHPHRIAKTRAIVLRGRFPLMKNGFTQSI